MYSSIVNQKNLIFLDFTPKYSSACLRRQGTQDIYCFWLPDQIIERNQAPLPRRGWDGGGLKKRMLHQWQTRQWMKFTHKPHRLPFPNFMRQLDGW